MRHYFLLFCLSIGSLQLFADDAAPVQRDVERWVQELDAPQLARRNAAEQALLDLGQNALPFLPSPDHPQTPEVAQRLERLRSRIAKKSVKVEVAKNTGDVRLGDADTLGEALEAISRDSGIEFEHEGDESLSIAPYPAVLPFWHALDYVLDQSKLDIDFYAGEGETLVLRPRAETRPERVDSAAYAGIYRLEPSIVTSRRVLHDPSLSGLSVELDLSWKPDAHPVGITLPMGQMVMRLDDGAKVIAQEPDGTIDLAPSTDIATTMVRLPFILPAGRPQRIVSLSGQIKSMLPGAAKLFEFPLNVAQQTQTADFVTVRIEDIRKNGPLHEVRLGIEFDGAGKAMESHRGWLLANEVYVTLANGLREEHLGYELYRHNESGLGIGYLFDIGETPGEAKLYYKTPSAVVQDTIDFVIQDIPMP